LIDNLLTDTTTDYDIKTPGQGIMTFNKDLWGESPDAAQLDILNTFNTMNKIKSAVAMGNLVCTEILCGVVNHMAPAG
jgi:hypothetical protein